METNLVQAKRGVTAFSLKMIAILGMTLDHIGIVFGNNIESTWLKCFLYAFGGLTFPIMAYLMGEGYKYTKNLNKYMLRLFIFAVITQPIYYWALIKQFNVLFTLLLGLLAIHVSVKVKNRIYASILIIILIGLSVFCDWGVMGVPMILLYYHLKGHWTRLIVPITIPYTFVGMMMSSAVMSGFVSLEDALPQIVYVVVGCTLTIPLLANYRGTQGKKVKYLFYVYYPLHIAILGIINGIIFNRWGIISNLF